MKVTGLYTMALVLLKSSVSLMLATPACMWKSQVEPPMLPVKLQSFINGIEYPLLFYNYSVEDHLSEPQQSDAIWLGWKKFATSY